LVTTLFPSRRDLLLFFAVAVASVMPLFFLLSSFAAGGGPAFAVAVVFAFAVVCSCLSF
jgi:hypothetical protein